MEDSHLALILFVEIVVQPQITLWLMRRNLRKGAMNRDIANAFRGAFGVLVGDYVQSLLPGAKKEEKQP